MTDTQKSSVQNEISTYLEYAHLQIAAEAFIDNTRGKTFHIPDNKEVKEVKPKDLADDLIKGNWHSSKFSKTFIIKLYIGIKFLHLSFFSIFITDFLFFNICRLKIIIIFKYTVIKNSETLNLTVFIFTN